MSDTVLGASASYAERLERAASGRRECLSQLLGSPLFSLTSMMGPMSEGPEWPSDAAWQAFAWDGCGGIVSDGLSDPWIELARSPTGLGLEVMVVSPDVAFQTANPMAIADTWLFPMTAEISHTLAMYPRLCDSLLRGQPLSLRFNIEHIKDGRGLVGALLHIPPAYRDLPLSGSSFSLVAATLLTPEELRWLAGKGEAGRRALLADLYDRGVGWRSLIHRPSCLPVATV